MSQFEICEYNKLTQTYGRTIGFGSGKDSEAAKTEFIIRTNWKPDKNKILWARNLLCC